MSQGMEEKQADGNDKPVKSKLHKINMGLMEFDIK